MQLALDSISKKVGAQTWLYDMNLSLQPNAVTVLLGATQAGKTSLMRIMAGLDVPTQGRVLVDGKDVTGTPVRERNVAMVYQQFINYPSMKVFDNIASPLKLRGEKNIDARVRELASRLNQARDCGANFLVTKPFSAAMLLERLAESPETELILLDRGFCGVCPASGTTALAVP